MQIDELRGELATLADEIDPFHGDATALHRRVRRRRVVISSLTVALAIVVAASSVAVAHKRSDSKIHVSGAGSKQVAAADMTHIDLIVVPAAPGVQRILDASPAVAQYARVLRGVRSAGAMPDAPLCALESSDGFAVEAATPGPGVEPDLAQALAGLGSAYDVSNYFGADMEIFLNTPASSTVVASIRAALATDHEVTSIRYVSQTDAYAIFKQDFRDQPALVQATKRSDVPPSFQVDVASGVSAEATAQGYQSMTGVYGVITGKAQRWLTRAGGVAPGNLAPSVCPKP